MVEVPAIVLIFYTVLMSSYIFASLFLVVLVAVILLQSVMCAGVVA